MQILKGIFNRSSKRSESGSTIMTVEETYKSQKTERETYQARSPITHVDSFHIDSFTNFDEVRMYMIREYMKGSIEIVFKVGFNTNPQKILAIFSDKRSFPFNNSCHCEVETSGRSSVVRIKVTQTQGFRVFLSVINRDYEHSLNESDKKVLDKVRDIHSKIINSSMNNYTKAKIIHDYLISTSSYDYDSYKRNCLPEVSYTPYGLLFEHKAVCQAYAETYMIFMTLFGIECMWVTGKLNESHNIASDNHAWNIIKLNGKYGHVDVTSDNPVPKNFGAPRQSYFFISDRNIDRTHDWDIGMYPLCI